MESKFTKYIRKTNNGRLIKLIRNKYGFSLLLFIVWLLFFDENNLLERIKDLREINRIEDNIDYYRTKIDEDTKRLIELKTNNENLEKFAREQYYMLKENEDVFIIVDDEE